MSEQAASCPTCGAEPPASARFCPQCGSRLDRDAGGTAVIPPPPDETGPVPVEVSHAEPHLFGVTPPLAALVLGLAAFGAGIVLFALGFGAAGLILLVAGLVLLAAFLAAAPKVPHSRVARASTRAIRSLRGRAELTRTSVAARSSSRRRLLRLRIEADDLRARRRERLTALGAAVYERDEAATEALRAEVARLDESIAAKEDEMAAVVSEAEERVQRARLEQQPTEMVEVPSYPPPDEGNPPEPVRVPEPYPPPDEGSPPEPARIPEPEPDPGSPPQPDRGRSA